MRILSENYGVDYLSTANRDILVTEDGSFTQRYVYDENSTRISAEYGYAAGTKRGDGGENLQSDFAANDVRKVWYRTSHLGSTLFAVDENGKVISHTIYDPWGNPLTETYTDTNFSGIDNSNNYTGYTWDEVLDLYFAQNRFYDPADHRFTQEDPIKDGENWYGYCENNPVIVIDRQGFDTYYFYDPYMWPNGQVWDNADVKTWSRRNADQNARLWEQALKKEFQTPVHLVPVNDFDELSAKWNAMNDTESNIECVMMNFHSQPERFEITDHTYEHTQFGSLADKNISVLIYLGCNGGHLSYENNIATILSKKPSIGTVIASDGTVWNQWGGDDSWNDLVGSVDDDGDWSAWEKSQQGTTNFYFDPLFCIGERTQNAGFFAYKFGLRIQLKNQQYSSVTDINYSPAKRHPGYITTRGKLLKEARSFDMVSEFWKNWEQRREQLSSINSQYKAA